MELDAELGEVPVGGEVGDEVEEDGQEDDNNIVQMADLSSGRGCKCLCIYPWSMCLIKFVNNVSCFYYE